MSSGQPSGVDGTTQSAPSNPPFVAAVWADMSELAKVKGTPFPTVGGVVDVLMLPGMWATILWRLANLCHSVGLKPISRILYFLNIVLFGAELHPGAVIGPGIVIPHPVGLAVANGSVFGARCRLMRSVAVGGSGDPKRPGHPHVGDDVWLMHGAKVFGPCQVGDRSVLGAMSLITADVPSDMFVFGQRRSDDMVPLSQLGLEDHGGSLPEDLVELGREAAAARAAMAGVASNGSSSNGVTANGSD